MFENDSSSFHEGRCRSFDLRDPFATRMQSELEGRPSVFIGYRPQFSAVRLDNRTTDRQSHAQPLRFGRIERSENAIETLRIESWARISHGDYNTLGFMGLTFLSHPAFFFST